MMDIAESIFTTAAKEILGSYQVEWMGNTIDLSPGWKRMTMIEAVREYVGIDFAAINTVVEGRMMPLMSAACQKTLNKPIDQLLFFSNQDKIYNDEAQTDEGEAEE